MIEVGRKSWIWDYAKALGKSVSQCAPKDFQMECGREFRMSATFKTVQEVEAVKVMLDCVIGKLLPMHRDMIEGDLREAKPAPSYREQLDKFLAVNAPAIAIETRRAETGTGSVEDESAGPSGHRPDSSPHKEPKP